MRTNNSNVKNAIVTLYFTLVVSAIAFLFVFKVFSEGASNALIIFSGIALGFIALFFLVHYISKYFEYDSDGLKVVLKNKGLMLSDKFNYRERVLEFHKHELVAFTFRNFIVYKTLTITIKDSKGHKSAETFNITLVTRKKRRYIRQSLTKIIKANKKTN